MSYKHKYNFEEKETIVHEYQSGEHGFRELCRKYGMAEQALKDWIRLYETFGVQGLQTGSTATHSAKEEKEGAVQNR